MSTPITRFAPAGLIFAAHSAAALEMDALLPPGIPGFGAAQGVTILTRLHPEYESLGIAIGGFTISPALTAGMGYDSSPNGAAPASALLNLEPSLLVEDQQLGFGAYGAGAVTQYPSQASQNTTGYTVALGERAVLPQHTLSLGFARLRAQETGFSLGVLAFSTPESFTVTALRGMDEIAAGMFTLTPEGSITATAFPDLSGEDRTDYRQALAVGFSDGGPARLAGRAQATESRYRDAGFNADTFEALAGIADNAEEIWDFRLLAGMAGRQPGTGKSLISPVAEAAADWMPDELDSLGLGAAREIDNPGQESAAGYTLTEAHISLDHEYLRNVILSGSAEVSHAAYFDGGLIETIFANNASVHWHLNRALALSAGYTFNDRQANFRRAANEHVVMLNITWTQ